MVNSYELFFHKTQKLFFQKSDSESRIGVIPNPLNNNEHVIKMNKIVFEAFKHEDKLNILVKHLSQAIEANKDHIEVINSLPVSSI